MRVSFRCPGRYSQVSCWIGRRLPASRSATAPRSRWPAAGSGRVDVLDLACGCQSGPPDTHRDVGVAAERTFLHVAVADVDPAQRVQQFGVGPGFGGGRHVGLGDDLHQRVPARLRSTCRHAVGADRAGLPASSRGGRGSAGPISRRPCRLRRPRMVIVPSCLSGSSNWLIW